MLGKAKEENYFDLFIGSAEYSCKVAEKTLELFNDFQNVEEKVDYIHSIEHSGDEHFHRLYSQLMKSFITPIEREDILEMAQKIDDVTDMVEDVANRMIMFDVKELREDAIPFMELIVQACRLMLIAITEFKNFAKSKTLPDKIMKLNNLEEDGDKFYKRAVQNLFISCKDPIEIFKWREIYHKMEMCMDACEDVADTIHGIIIKNT